MHKFASLHHAITNQILPETVGRSALEPRLLEAIAVELPKDPSHGDVSTNVAMVLAKPLGMKPRDLAEKLVPGLSALPHVSAVEIAGPGFINLRFNPIYWQQEIAVILKEMGDYGSSDLGGGERINIEYVSANPTGPMHIGHARGAVVGDALARLLEKASFDVVREYYINDAGSQIDTLAHSAYLRYLETYGETITIPEGYYPGEYLKEVGVALKTAYGGTLLNEPDDVWLPEVRVFAVEQMMDVIREDLALLGIHHDVFTSEQQLRDDGLVERAIEALRDDGLIYQGVLEPPKGKTPDDWEPTEQTLFKSSEYGDDSDRAVIKSNGDYAYLAGDIGYGYDKIERGFDALVMVLGADHAGYVKRMKAIISALSNRAVPIDICLCQLVKLMEGGEPVKMSKRSGAFVTVRDVVHDVGKDALRFMMLTRKSEQPLDFDLQKVKEQTRDNPVFYVQYAHARCKSLLRMAGESQPDAVGASALADKVDMSLLASADELSLMQLMASFPRQVEHAAKAREPHRIAYFVQELAAAFHAFWNKGGEDKTLRFVHEDDVALTTARLALARAVAIVLAAGLDILGVEPMDELR